MMHWFLTYLTKGGKTIEAGWMLAENGDELIQYANIMGYGIDLTYLGPADMSSILPKILTFPL